MFDKTVRLICLVTVSLAVISVDACGGPSPCIRLKCSYPSCDDFYNARCISKNDRCPGTANVCRCHDKGADLKCCHAVVCAIEDLAESPSMAVTGLPPGTDPAALGPSRAGIPLSSDASGRLQSYFHFNWGVPFKVRSVEFRTSPDQVTSFQLTIKGPYQPAAGQVFQVNGNSINFSPDEVGYVMIIQDVVIDGRNRVTLTNIAINGCIDPACEEAGGSCLIAEQGNTGKCALGQTVADFYVGPGFGCRGRTDNIRCCMQGRPWSNQ